MRVLSSRTSRCSPTRSPAGCAGRRMAVDVAYDGDGRAGAASASTTTTWSCSTATCRSCTATTCAARLVEPSGARRVLMLTAAGRRRRPGRGAGARRRRLPGQAVRVRRADRPGCARWAGGPRPAAPPVLERAGIRLDPARREVFRDGRHGRRWPARSSPCWRCCCAPTARVVSAEQLLEKAWDENTDPFTNVGPGDGDEAAPQARRAAGHRDRPRRGYRIP